ncbi:hypothetical protein Prudu_005734, partial [Prunus dulcis]
YKGFKREDERVLGFARESRRGGEEISGEGFVVVLVAEVISGDFYVVGNFGWVQANCRKAKERGYFIRHKPTTQKSWRNRWCMAYGDWESPPGKSVVQHIPTHFQSIGSVKWGPISKEQEDEVEWVRAQLSETERECGNLVTQKNLLESGLLQGSNGWHYKGSTKVAVDIDEAEMQKRLRESRAKKAEKGAGKRPRDDDEGRAPPKLPFGMEDVFAEGVEKVDFGRLRQQKKEEVPLVNVFLEGVKSDPEALARTPASSFIDRAQKTILTSAYAFGEMYVSMAKADKEIQRLKRRDELAKSKMAEAQEAIREKNALLCKRRPWPRRWRS